MSAKVWLVDDDLSVRESLGFLLKTVDYEVADFGDLATFDAVASAEALPLRGCLLVDVRLPGMDGLNWLTEQCARHPLLPVILMTAYGTLDVCRSTFQEGAFDIFTKPLDIEPLLATLHRAMNESEQRAVQQG